MFLLQATTQSATSFTILFLGTLGMLILTVGIIVFMVIHNKRIQKYNERIQTLQEEQQRILLNASIKMQEEERQRLAADLHDDAGPLLASVRLYLNENLVNQDKSTQLQSILQARQIVDDAIQLIRNLSHNLMPPTLKNFGLESAINDLFQKISGSGVVNASCRFHDYRERLKEDKEMVLFRMVQELISNILKHSNASFIHLTQNVHEGRFYLRLHHDGRGIIQTDFEKLNLSKTGLGLKNITSRLQLVNGNILFEKDISQTYYKVTIDLPREEPFG